MSEGLKVCREQVRQQPRPSLLPQSQDQWHQEASFSSAQSRTTLGLVPEGRTTGYRKGQRRGWRTRAGIPAE